MFTLQYYTISEWQTRNSKIQFLGTQESASESAKYGPQAFFEDFALVWKIIKYDKKWRKSTPILKPISSMALRLPQTQVLFTRYSTNWPVRMLVLPF